MAKHVAGYQYIGFDWSMVAVTFIIVLMRLYVRIYLQVRVQHAWSWIMSESFVVLGWLLFLGVAICDSISVHAGGKNMDPDFKMTPKQEVRFLKAQFAWSWMFKPSIYFMKYALLCFYLELIQKVQHKRMWLAVVVTAVLNTVGLVGQWLFIGLQCVPAKKQWTFGGNNCANLVSYPAFTWGMHVFTDILVFLLPFALLRAILSSGKHSVGEWYGALVMFGLGIINVLSAIACMVLRLQPENFYDTPRTDLGIAITFLFTVQIATGIAIPCCPQVRIFIKHVTGHYEKEQKRLATMEYLSSQRSRSMSKAMQGGLGFGTSGSMSVTTSFPMPQGPVLEEWETKASEKSEGILGSPV